MEAPAVHRSLSAVYVRQAPVSCYACGCNSLGTIAIKMKKFLMCFYFRTKRIMTKQLKLVYVHIEF